MISMPSIGAATLKSTRKQPTIALRAHYKVNVNEKLCKGCYLCIRFCPVGVFVRSSTIGDLGYNIAEVQFPEKCTGCKACLLYCPDFAVAVEKENDKD
jgi:2-oxoglutarate ferredoxin oxidoreductase subunit delta